MYVDGREGVEEVCKFCEFILRSFLFFLVNPSSVLSGGGEGKKAVRVCPNLEKVWGHPMLPDSFSLDLTGLTDSPRTDHGLTG